MEKKPKIVCAATKVFVEQNGIEEIVIVCSPRHWDMVAHATFNKMFQDPVKINKEIQGFIDQYGDFYTRQEAWVVANKNNQIIRRVGGDHEKLYSENLY